MRLQQTLCYSSLVKPTGKQELPFLSFRMCFVQEISLNWDKSTLSITLKWGQFKRIWGSSPGLLFNFMLQHHCAATKPSHLLCFSSLINITSVRYSTEQLLLAGIIFNNPLEILNSSIYIVLFDSNQMKRSSFPLLQLDREKALGWHRRPDGPLSFTCNHSCWLTYRGGKHFQQFQVAW